MRIARQSPLVVFGVPSHLGRAKHKRLIALPAPNHFACDRLGVLGIRASKLHGMATPTRTTHSTMDASPFQAMRLDPPAKTVRFLANNQMSGFVRNSFEKFLFEVTRIGKERQRELDKILPIECLTSTLSHAVRNRNQHERKKIRILRMPLRGIRKDLAGTSSDFVLAFHVRSIAHESVLVKRKIGEPPEGGSPRHHTTSNTSPFIFNLRIRSIPRLRHWQAMLPLPAKRPSSSRTVAGSRTNSKTVRRL